MRIFDRKGLELLFVAIIAQTDSDEVGRAQFLQRLFQLLGRLVEIHIAVIAQAEYTEVQTLETVLFHLEQRGVEVLRIARELSLARRRRQEEDVLVVHDVVNVKIVHGFHRRLDASSFQVLRQLLCKVLRVARLGTVKNTHLIGSL